MTFSPLNQFCRFCVLSAALLPLVMPWSSRVVQACDTPVYRYAMYRWQPAPFEVYFFHHAAVNESDSQVHKAIKEAANDLESPTNIVLLPVDLREDADLVGVPPDVKEAWQARNDRTLPSYMVVSPQGMQVYDGALDIKTVADMTHSPAREKIAKALENGAASVLVLLSGEDDKATHEAEMLLRSMSAEIENGKINLYAGPLEQTDSDEDEAKQKGVGQHVGVIVVSRDDPNEAWLIRSLMAVEADLHDYTEPMVFAVYGRGRALPPYIGKGITRDNLIECVQFVTGACSCTVKEQNPGADLLVSYNWEFAAETLADKYGSEEGNETRFGAADLFPDLIIPEAQTVSIEDQDSPTLPEADETSDSNTDQLTDVSQSDALGQADSAANAENTQEPNNDEPVELASRARQLPTSIDSSVSSGNLSIWVVALGLGVAVVVLFFTTLLIIRPR